MKTQDDRSLPFKILQEIIYYSALPFSKSRKLLKRYDLLSKTVKSYQEQSVSLKNELYPSPYIDSVINSGDRILREIESFTISLPPRENSLGLYYSTLASCLRSHVERDIVSLKNRKNPLVEIKS